MPGTHRDLRVNVKRGYLWQPVSLQSPPMQRLAVGDDLGSKLPLRLAALCVIYFQIRIFYLLDQSACEWMRWQIIK